MSVWTDVRDGVTAPFRYGFETIKAPFELIGNIVSGENVGDSLSRFLSTIVAMPAAIIDDMTAGYLSNDDIPIIGQYIKGSSDFLDKDLSGSRRRLWLGAAETGGTILAATALAPTLGATTTLGQIGTGVGVSQAGKKLFQGDLSGALGGISSVSGVDVPPEVLSLKGDVQNLISQIPKNVQQQVTAGNSYQSVPVVTPVETEKTNYMPLLAVGAVVSYLVIRGRK